MKNLTPNDVAFLIDCLKNGKEIPEIYKYAIFPTKQKEYELVYAGKMRKEDVLADSEEAKPVPLQIEKVFNGKKYPLHSQDWHNLLVFGDNLQILKTFCENKDPLIKDKIKGKVKLIYIDPPFASADEFQNKDGAKAYNDKVKGAEFIEFLRRRLIVAREILADDGSICVHLDQKMSHYVKILMDEIFSKENFVNEIVWHYTGNSMPIRCFPKKHDVIFIYSKNQKIEFDFSQILEPYSESTLKRYNHVDKDGKRYKISALRDGKREIVYAKEGKYPDDVWDMPVPRAKEEITGYPTQKPEILLERIIKASTKEGNLVMDFFCGSGTTLAVAEKLNRRWIGCDIGKLAIYTTQKRLLGIDQSKDLENPKKKYNKPVKSFSVVTSGLYDLGKVFALKKDEYIRFVKDLFEIKETKTKKVGGIEIDGKKREFYVKIFPYWEFREASVDENYLQELHKSIGKKIDGRFYLIAPANNVNFISDYQEIGDVRYYFLKIPYQIIKELHKVQFKKLRQPQSKNQINDLDEAIGFHFIRQPEVKSEIKKSKDKIILTIKKFETAYSRYETGEKLENFESLAMLLVDLDYNGERFMMADYCFAEDLQNQNKIQFLKNACGKKIMLIYIDIYGNEFRETFNIK